MNAPLTEFRPEVFARALVRLRDDVRLSQRGLARASGVSHTAISNLEEGSAPAPHPSMLSKLARGLATSGLGVLDPRRAEVVYLDLMRAAGYVPSDLVPQVTVLDMREALMAKGFRPDQSHVVDQILDDMADKSLLSDGQRAQILNAVAAMLASHRETPSDR